MDHPHTEATPSPAQPERPDGEARALKLTLALYVVVFAAKLAVYLLTGVMAVFAEAMHTLTDILISGFLVMALIYSRRPPDEEHMFGHGRAQSIAGLVAAVLFIAFTAYRLYEEAVPRLFQPEAGRYANLWMAVAVLALSMLVPVIAFLALLRSSGRGAAVRAQMLELLNDELGLIAALGATLLVMAGWSLGDPIASIVVATVIAINGLYLLRQNFSMLVGRAPKPEFMARVRQAALSVPDVVAVREILAEVIGPDVVHAGIRLAVPGEMPVAEAARVAERVRERVHQGSDESGYCVIQLEAASAEERERITASTPARQPTPDRR